MRSPTPSTPITSIAILILVSCLGAVKPTLARQTPAFLPLTTKINPSLDKGRHSGPPDFSPTSCENYVQSPTTPTTTTTLQLADGIDLETVKLVTSQENYGLAIVSVIEGAYSFYKAPSLDQAKILILPVLATIVLFGVSGPMISSDDATVASVQTGLAIATFVSLGLGLGYLARLLAPYSPTEKEWAFLGLLFSIAGFFSFTQNLVVDGFLTLPTLPSIPLPSISIPSFDFPTFDE